MKLGNFWNRFKTMPVATRVLYLCLVVSITILLVYLLDLNYTDQTLFFMLVILRYSSFILCIFSLYKLIINLFHTFRSPSVMRAMKMLVYLLFIFYGIFIILFESFIVTISGGN
jgi:hypothetical protein